MRHVEPRFSSDVFNLSATSLLFTKGRQALLAQINKRLASFELILKEAGAKEPPSALGKHAKWWFEHYVHNRKFIDIANEIANYNSHGGPHEENIRKAVIKFSQLISIEPVERI